MTLDGGFMQEIDAIIEDARNYSNEILKHYYFTGLKESMQDVIVEIIWDRAGEGKDHRETLAEYSKEAMKLPWKKIMKCTEEKKNIEKMKQVMKSDIWKDNDSIAILEKMKELGIEVVTMGNCGNYADITYKIVIDKIKEKLAA